MFLLGLLCAIPAMSSCSGNAAQKETADNEQVAQSPKNKRSKVGGP